MQFATPISRDKRSVYDTIELTGNQTYITDGNDDKQKDKTDCLSRKKRAYDTDRYNDS